MVHILKRQLQTSASSHNKITGTRLTYPLQKIRKLDKMYELAVFRHTSGSTEVCDPREK